MPPRPLWDDKSSDLLVRKATALDIDERSQGNATMNEAGKIGLGGHLLAEDLAATPLSVQSPIIDENRDHSTNRMNNDATVRAVVPIDVRNRSRPKYNHQSDDDHSGPHLSSPNCCKTTSPTPTYR